MFNASNEDLSLMSYNSKVFYENNFRMNDSINKLENVLSKE